MCVHASFPHTQDVSLSSLRYWDLAENWFFPMPTSLDKGHLDSLFICLCTGEYFQPISILTCRAHIYSPLCPCTAQDMLLHSRSQELTFWTNSCSAFCGLQQGIPISISLGKKKKKLHNRIFSEVLQILGHQ